MATMSNGLVGALVAEAVVSTIAECGDCFVLGPRGAAFVTVQANDMAH